jgi:hypothetical protein
VWKEVITTTIEMSVGGVGLEKEKPGRNFAIH